MSLQIQDSEVKDVWNGDKRIKSIWVGDKKVWPTFSVISADNMDQASNAYEENYEKARSQIGDQK